MKATALVLGGYINGYSIVKELHEEGVENIALFHSGRSVAGFSNKINCSAKIDKTPESLLKELRKLNEQFDYIVPFPTDDLQVENLYQIREEIKGFCYLPLNPDTVMQSFDKYYQYAICEQVGVPYPKTRQLNTIADLDNVDQLTFPILIKPSTRVDIVQNVFRNIYLEDITAYAVNKERLKGFIEKGIEFIASEFVPGDDTNIYAYTCYRSQDGKIQNEWTGKKLTQYPDNYGVFCSSSNEAPKKVLIQGQKLVGALNAFGIIEPEFKYDARDGKYKLMEVNLRSMMWHRTGKISGVRLHKSMYDYSIGKKVSKDIQLKQPVVHFVYMFHEIGNLIARKGYWKNFKRNVFGGDKRVWAVFDPSDLKPYLYSLYLLTRMVVSKCLRRLKIR
jgi:predicted ATP-grasp superfamily ATP-dependent carboligase